MTDEILEGDCSRESDQTVVAKKHEVQNRQGKVSTHHKQFGFSRLTFSQFSLHLFTSSRILRTMIDTPRLFGWSLLRFRSVVGLMLP